MCAPYSIRAAVRAMLATTAPSAAGAFTKAARARLTKAYPSHIPTDRDLFVLDEEGYVHPTTDLAHVLRHARSLYGAGLGLLALDVFNEIIRSLFGQRWEPDGDTADVLAVVDADLCQAIQSTKEEIEAGRAGEPAQVHAVVARLRMTLQQSAADVMVWSRDSPFERAAASVDCWKL